MGSVTSRRQWQCPFEIGVSEVETIVKILDPVVALHYIEIACLDEVDRKFCSVEELRHYRNFVDKAIIKIDLHFRNDSYSKHGTVSIGRGQLSKDWRFTSGDVKIRLVGQEEEVGNLRNKVEEELLSMKPWYSWACRTDKNQKVIGFAGFVSFLAIAMALYILFVTNEDVTIIKEGMTELRYIVFLTNVAIIFTLISGILMWLVRRLKGWLQNRYFPAETYKIGEGCKRWKEISETRKHMMWTVPFAFLGLAATVYFSLNN